MRVALGTLGGFRNPRGDLGSSTSSLCSCPGISSCLPLPLAVPGVWFWPMGVRGWAQPGPSGGRGSCCGEGGDLRGQGEGTERGNTGESRRPSAQEG